MEFRSPRIQDEAISVLAALGHEARILAGGTDLMLQHRRGELRAKVLLHIGRVAELRDLQRGPNVRIGALVTHDQLRHDPFFRATYPGLVEAAATVGGWQTQAAGTLGGNICNASPAADTLPPLLIGDAEVELLSTGGTRHQRVEEFVLGRRVTDRRPDELLVGVRLPLPPRRTGETYLKVAPRGAMEVALVGVAVRLTLGRDQGSISDARIAVCAAGPRPFRARAAENALVGGWPERDALAEAGDLLARQAEPIDDARATARYRRRILPALLARAVERCVERASAA